MKSRESGMPDEELWASFFNVESVLDKLGLQSCAGDVVEFGCGYGTFTIPAARRVITRTATSSRIQTAEEPLCRRPQ